MNCSQCGKPVVFSQPICPHCGYFAKMDRVVTIEAPASRARSPRFISRRAHWRLALAEWRQRRRFRPEAGTREFIAGFFPGYGYCLLRRPVLGAFVFASVLGWCIAGLAYGGESGYAFFGLAAALHSYSLMDLCPAKSKDSRTVRFLLMGGLLLAVMVVFYLPVARLLLGPIGQRVDVPARQVAEYQFYFFLGNLLRIVLFVAPALALALILSLAIFWLRRWTRR